MSSFTLEIVGVHPAPCYFRPIAVPASLSVLGPDEPQVGKVWQAVSEQEEFELFSKEQQHEYEVWDHAIEIINVKDPHEASLPTLLQGQLDQSLRRPWRTLREVARLLDQLYLEVTHYVHQRELELQIRPNQSQSPKYLVQGFSSALLTSMDHFARMQISSCRALTFKAMTLIGAPSAVYDLCINREAVKVMRLVAQLEPFCFEETCFEIEPVRCRPTPRSVELEDGVHSWEEMDPWVSSPKSTYSEFDIRSELTISPREEMLGYPSSSLEGRSRGASPLHIEIPLVEYEDEGSYRSNLEGEKKGSGKYEDDFCKGSPSVSRGLFSGIFSCGSSEPSREIDFGRAYSKSLSSASTEPFCHDRERLNFSRKELLLELRSINSHIDERDPYPEEMVCKLPASPQKRR